MRWRRWRMSRAPSATGRGPRRSAMGWSASLARLAPDDAVPVSGQAARLAARAHLHLGFLGLRQRDRDTALAHFAASLEHWAATGARRYATLGVAGIAAVAAHYGEATPAA